MAKFAIAGRMVGDEYPPLVIAEIGINHGGCLKTACTMVDSAARAGAEVIKHQTHVIEDEMSSEARRVIPGNSNRSIYEIMAGACLSLEDEHSLKNYVEDKGMFYLSTPFSPAAATRLEYLGVAAYKIGSGECSNYPLVEQVASYGKPVILSTGMNGIESIQRSVDILRKYNAPYALLHCTNVYPTPHRLVRLGALDELRQAFPDAVIGLSDHTINNNACLGAVAMGASILERHFTDHKGRTGPDIVCSMDERELGELIVGSREVYECRGGSKGAVPEETVTIKFAFSTAVTVRAVKKGEVFSTDNLALRRPAKGDIRPEDYAVVIGRSAARDLDKDVHLIWNDIC